MDMIPLHSTQSLWIVFDEFPCFHVCSVNDSGILRCGSDRLHLHLYGFNTVTLVRADEFFWAFGCVEGCDRKSLFVIIVNDLFDLT